MSPSLPSEPATSRPPGEKIGPLDPIPYENEIMTGPVRATLLLLLAAASCDHSVVVGADRTVDRQGGAAACDVEAAELCNRRDDDCDGAVDEGDVCEGGCRVVRLGSPRCAIRADGALFCWGANAGAGDGFDQSQPVLVPIHEPVVQVSRPCARGISGRVFCWTRGHPPDVVSALGNTVAAVAADGQDSIAACARGSDQWGGLTSCWTTAYGAAPSFAGDPGPRPLPGAVDRVAELAMGRALCARKTDGTIWCSPVEGRDRPLARIPALGADNLQLSVGEHLCVVKRDGSVVCLGLPLCWSEPGINQGQRRCFATNTSGELGTGDTDEKDGPVLGGALGGDVRQVSAGPAVTCVLTGAGRVVCVGAHHLGRTPLPVTPPGLEADVEEVVFPCARKRDGSLWCWGRYPGDGGLLAAAPVRIDVCTGRQP
jgi:hypothetical protein